MASTSAALDGLPKQFVTAMKTLFEIMDDRNSGYVKLIDLENFWSEEGLAGLPKGVIESLRKVTPTNGLLSFERFCAGLKICLLRYQSDQQKVDGKLPQRSPSAPLLDLENGSTPPPIPPPIHPRSPTATVRPNNAMLHSRTLSMPQLVPNQLHANEEEPPPIPVHMRKPETSMAIKERRAGIHSVYGNVPLFRNTPPPQVPMMGPPKPPRVVQSSAPQNNVITNGALMMRTRSEISARSTGSSKTLVIDTKNQLPVASIAERLIAKAEVRTALQQWQMAQMDSEKNGGINKNATNGLSSKRREPRRHTLQNGIDQSMLRRIHILEQERQVLTSGLQALERARDWFNSQLGDVQERIKSFGKSNSGSNDYSTEAHQERLGFKISRIEEVSRQLIMLIENADRGFPAHMNLALADRNKIAKTPGDGVDENNEEEVNRILRRLKSQNHQLTEEVGRKSERITMLEKEKSSLIRELFQVAMKKKPRRNVTSERDEEDNASSCSTPVKDKENFSPRPSLINVKQNRYNILLRDFDDNVAMTKSDILTQSQVTVENVTYPFVNVIMKMPPQIKNKKWADYKKMQTSLFKLVPETSNTHAFAIPSVPLKLETPALRSSSRLAKNKLPVITPKFDPSTPATVNKRYPKPGETLVSLKGSPVGIPNQAYTTRGISNLAVADETDVLASLLNNPEIVTNALKDKNTCKAFVKAYNSAKMRKD
uniref:EOG090X08VB n=1 Tax=Simocephalus serrulatus TaxID=117539 RepID=A0A4Y7NQG0_9CRUS|nr:EOG090X08VB [Simocephalus serrulatus]SVE94335.1 EOG090X08VB [Simocephalus serrulatus]